MPQTKNQSILDRSHPERLQNLDKQEHLALFRMRCAKLVEQLEKGYDPEWCLVLPIIEILNAMLFESNKHDTGGYGMEIRAFQRFELLMDEVPKL